MLLGSFRGANLVRNAQFCAFCTDSLSYRFGEGCGSQECSRSRAVEEGKGAASWPSSKMDGFASSNWSWRRASYEADVWSAESVRIIWFILHFIGRWAFICVYSCFLSNIAIFSRCCSFPTIVTIVIIKVIELHFVLSCINALLSIFCFY